MHKERDTRSALTLFSIDGTVLVKVDADAQRGGLSFLGPHCPLKFTEVFDPMLAAQGSRRQDSDHGGTFRAQVKYEVHHSPSEVTSYIRR